MALSGAGVAVADDGAGLAKPAAVGDLPHVGLTLPQRAPITICDKGVAVLQGSEAACAALEKVKSHAKLPVGLPAHSGSGKDVKSLVNIPITICGNAVAVLGVANAHCATLVTAVKEAVAKAKAESGKVKLPEGLPITICGHDVALIGSLPSPCDAFEKALRKLKEHAKPPVVALPGAPKLPDLKGIIVVPITICGNSVAILGVAKAQCAAIGLPVLKVPPLKLPTGHAGGPGKPYPGSHSSPTATAKPTTVVPPKAPSDSGAVQAAPKKSGSFNLLADTGASAAYVAPIGLALFLAGFLLYRRFRRPAAAATQPSGSSEG
jgi:hypothetical protein